MTTPLLAMSIACATLFLIETIYDLSFFAFSKLYKAPINAPQALKNGKWYLEGLVCCLAAALLALSLLQIDLEDSAELSRCIFFLQFLAITGFQAFQNLRIDELFLGIGDNSFVFRTSLIMYSLLLCQFTAGLTAFFGAYRFKVMMAGKAVLIVSITLSWGFLTHLQRHYYLTAIKYNQFGLARLQSHTFWHFGFAAIASLVLCIINFAQLSSVKQSVALYQIPLAGFSILQSCRRFYIQSPSFSNYIWGVATQWKQVRESGWERSYS